jgi:integrase/recombinase XerD
MDLGKKVWILFKFGFRIKSKLLDLMRHSRAMHLYQKGNDLALIQQWLGHVNLETTLVYAYADTEHKRKALEASVDPNSPLAKRRNAQRFTLSDDDTVRKLYGLV